MPQGIIIDLLKHQIVLNNRFLNNDRGHMKKLNSAILQQSSAQKQNLNLHRIFEREKSDPWFVNLTDVRGPDSVQDIFRLGSFRYVDDTLLCVPLDKLQKLIDTFNNYHPRIQFTHEMERDNRISFLDLEINKPQMEKEGRGFGRLPSFFLSSFFCLFFSRFVFC